MIPALGIADAYGGSDTPEYYNAMGFFVLSESCTIRPSVVEEDY